MSSLVVERDTEILIDTQLRNLGWNSDPHASSRNVYQQRAKTEDHRKKLQGRRPDYILYSSNSNTPIAVIEAKKPGRNIHEALQQGRWYADKIDAPLVFATDGVFTKTLHIKTNKPLTLNGEEIDELIRETLALKYLISHEVNTLDKKVIKSRGELISLFGTVNNILREEGLQQGLERFSEFSNILFLKVLSEIEDAKEERGERSKVDRAYRWDHFKNKKGTELISYISDTVLKSFATTYSDENIFQPLQIKHPENLKEIINLLDGLQLTDINADIKGDAFEYFIRSYSASNPSDLGEIFTPRHIVKTMVKLLNPQIGETIYDPFCGTGGMLIVAFKHLMDTMPRNDRNLKTLKTETIYGSELTKTASIAKMNMILAGDGHSNIERKDSLANPVDKKYDIVLSNMPFAQTTRYGDRYPIPNADGDLICPQHCFRALKDGGRMALIVPGGFISNTPKGFQDLRKYLIDNATLKSVISLPWGAFQPYNKAKADILFFTDVRTSKSKGHYWYFDVKNDGYSLDKKRRRQEGKNDLELILSENDLENEANEYLHSLGIHRVNFDEVRKNGYILKASAYIDDPVYAGVKYSLIRLGDVLELSGQDRVGSDDAPVMSITMNQGLIDQSEKFKKRIASTDLSKYKKVYLNELVVGFPIDEGVLGFQFKYPFAAVSPAYAVWKLKTKDIDLLFLDMLLRSPKMREIYRSNMQGAVDRRRSVPRDVFLEIKIPVPSVQIQKRIVEKHYAIEKAIGTIKTLEQDIRNDFDNLWEKKSPVLSDEKAKKTKSKTK